jgi:hypothetical protein
MSVSNDMQKFMKRLLFAVICSLLLCSIANASDPAMAVRDLYDEADVVAFIRTNSADNDIFKFPVCKAYVLTELKGIEFNETIYFAPCSYYEINREYLVFLKKAKSNVGNLLKNVEIRQCTNSFNFEASYFESLLVDELIVTYRQRGYEVRFPCDKVMLPTSLHIDEFTGENGYDQFCFTPKDEFISFITGRTDLIN